MLRTDGIGRRELRNDSRRRDAANACGAASGGELREPQIAILPRGDEVRLIARRQRVKVGSVAGDVHASHPPGRAAVQHPDAAIRSSGDAAPSPYAASSSAVEFNQRAVKGIDGANFGAKFFKPQPIVRPHRDIARSVAGEVFRDRPGRRYLGYYPGFSIKKSLGKPDISIRPAHNTERNAAGRHRIARHPSACGHFGDDGCVEVGEP